MMDMEEVDCIVMNSRKNHRIRSTLEKDLISILILCVIIHVGCNME